jgi:hypothetical protein
MAAAIKIALEIKADPALIDAAQQFATVVAKALGVELTSVVQTVETVDAANAATPEKKSARKEKPAASTAHIAPPPADPTPPAPQGTSAVVIDFPKAAPAPAAPAAQAPPATAPAKVTLEQARAAARLLADKKSRDAVAALVGTFGVTSISALPEEAYAPFVNQALAQAQA